MSKFQPAFVVFLLTRVILTNIMRLIAQPLRPLRRRNLITKRREIFPPDNRTAP
jgi:hypothetical protein